MPRRMALSDHDAKILIREVKRRGCLWDPDDDRYNDRYHMARGWSEISNILHMPEDCLRVKWKNMRDLFKKEMRKYGPVIDDYTGKWKHYASLAFLSKGAVLPENTSENNEDNSSDDKELLITKQEYVELEGDPGGEGNNHEVEVYFNESLDVQDPLPDKRIKLSSSEDDFDIMFLKSLAPYFKRLDPIRKLVVRSKMQDMLLNEIAAQSSTTAYQFKKS